jgi:outer membrane receptor protein involved in Fe transport
MRLLYTTLASLLLLSATAPWLYAQPERNIRRKREETTAPVKKEPETPPTTSTPSTTAPTEFILKGKIVDANDGSPLMGATVRMKDSQQGTVTSMEGDFTLKVPGPEALELVVSYVGYTSRIVAGKPGPIPLVVQLKEGVLSAEEVVVSASRYAEKVKESSVAVQKLSLGELRNSPQLNFYESINTLKEMDGVNVGIGYKVYNARGFLAVINNRFSQRFDGIEFLVPGNNASAGNLLAPTDIDVENAEIIVGSASALYGPNAINGLLNLKTRSPIDYPGISFTTRVGVNHISSPSYSPQPMGEASLRFAQKLNDKFGYKVVLSTFQARDWVGDNTADGANYAGTTNDLRFAPGPGNPGYDGTNLFGDGNAFTFSSSSFVSLIAAGPGGTSLQPITDNQTQLRVARTGYLESQLTDHNFSNYKFSVGANYRFKPGYELSYSSHYSVNNAITPFIVRTQIRNFQFHQHRFEISGPNFSFRVYGSFQNNSGYIDLSSMANALNRTTKSDVNWFFQYLSAFNEPTVVDFLNQQRQIIQPGAPLLVAGDNTSARTFADGDNSALAQRLAQLGDPRAVYFGGGARLAPGTPQFDAALGQIRNTNITERLGSRIRDFTGLYHAEGQYDLSDLLKVVNVQVGGSYRIFNINSQGTFYSDLPNQPKSSYEYGAFVQLSKPLADDLIRLTVSGRVDANQFTRAFFSPRAAITVGLDRNKRGVLRLSYLQAYRLPTFVQQFQDLNLGPYRQISSQSFPQDLSNLPNTNFTLTSINEFKNSILSGNANPDLAKRLPFQVLQPEVINSFELGFRGTLGPGSTYIDLDMFYSSYNDFIGLVPVVGPRDPTSTSLDAVSALDYERVQSYQVWANLPDRFVSYGYSLGLSTNLTNNWSLSSNFSYIQFTPVGLQTNVGLVDAYNTPRYKANINLRGDQLLKYFGLGVTYRWVDSYEFVVPNFRGFIPSFNVVDLSISFIPPRTGLQFKLGGTNIFNNRHVEVTFGPTVGAVFYFQISFDKFLFYR